MIGRDMGNGARIYVLGVFRAKGGLLEGVYLYCSASTALLEGREEGDFENYCRTWERLFEGFRGAEGGGGAVGLLCLTTKLGWGVCGRLPARKVAISVKLNSHKMQI